MRVNLIVERVMRRLLWEAELEGPKAEAPKGHGTLAVYRTDTKEGHELAILYDPEYAKKTVKSGSIWKKDERALGTILIKGLVAITKPDGPCWGASELKRISSPKHAGILYKIAYQMAPSGRLIIDREPGKISDDAKRSWFGAFGKVEKYRLDDKEHRGKHHHTEDPQDDCSLVGPDEEGNALNWAYESGGGQLGELTAAHDNLMNDEEFNTLMNDKELNPHNKRFLDVLLAAAQAHWGNSYGL
jgi:hypothetical protein